MTLTNTKIKNAKAKVKQYKLFDGGGLYLLCRINGSKLWQMKYRFAGREKTLSFGQYPVVSLAEVREARTEAKKLLIQGIDPSQKKQQNKLEKQLEARNTLEAIAIEWHGQKQESWTVSHAKKVLRRLFLVQSLKLAMIYCRYLHRKNIPKVY